jgi:MFS family permease
MKRPVQSEKFSRGILLIIIMVSSFFTPFMGSAVNIALPSIGRDLSMNAVALSWIPMAYLLAAGIMLVPFGKLADIFGRKKMLLYGNIFYTIATVFCSVSFSGTMLIVSRLMQGIGAAMMLSSSMAIIVSAFPPEIRGRVIGFNTMAVYTGLSAAPWVGGILTEHLGWQSIFYTTAAASLLVSAGIIAKIKSEWAEAGNDPFDLKGTIIYVFAMLALMYGFSKLPENYAIFLTAAGLAGIIVFVVAEEKTSFPVLNIKLFTHNRIFAFSNLAALINYSATFAISFVLTFYLQDVMGMSPGNAGLFLMVQPAVMAVVAIVSGNLSDRMDSRFLSSAGMSVIVGGLLLLANLKTGSSETYMLVSLIILGFGFGLFSSPNTNSVMSSVEKRYLGIASATLGTMRATGQMFSMAIAAMAINVFIGEADINATNIEPFMAAQRIIFLIFALLCFLGVFASLARGKRNNLDTPPPFRHLP